MTARRRRRPTGAAAAAVLLAVGTALAACGTIKQAVDPDAAQLERFKALHAGRDYGAIAAEEVSCGPPDGDAACAQLHLIKGDACFALAKAGRAPEEHYACATEELTAGLDRSPASGGRSGGGLASFEERLLEALRERQDLARSRAESAPFTAELRARADGFRAAHPGHPAGYYYGASARLTEILHEVVAGGAGPDTCGELDALLELVKGPPSPRAAEYAANLARLGADAAGVKRAVPGCAP